ncbi:MAG TPA: S41 family peptidase [Patescibacteria group bacterium]|nr:S41 family peptidase [Patescibacteria group bacterium]
MNTEMNGMKPLRYSVVATFLVLLLLWGSLAAVAAPVATDEKPDAPTNAVSLNDSFADSVNGKENLLKAYSIHEISRYLAQMEPADAVAALKVFRVMQLLKSKYVGDVTTAALLTGALKGTVNALDDPYSVYMDPKMYKDLMVSTKGSFGGVGLVLGMKEKMLTVVAPIEGTPGEKAGIKSGDQILRIDDKETKDLSLDEAVGMIRGTEGTQVILNIRRGAAGSQNYTLTRTNIQIKTVGGKMLDNGIGYIRLSMFSETTDRELQAKLTELEGKGLKAVVLDLRNNPGGLLEEGIKVARFFVPKGPVVSVVRKDGSRETSYSELEKSRWPLAVLINGGSASASEIVAGAIQDTGAGTLIGTKSFGKGSVQTVVQIDQESAVKFTIAKYYTPKDRSIHGIGIEPDIVVELPEIKDTGKDAEQEQKNDTKKDPQLEKAVEVLKQKIQ